ncbi:Protein CBG16587 [Caenorhabditis briggsae]|uniref:NR LBD domain-containing protein n=3 Tax=Caenorhabditis briggsae TaxID=6238 RepID=A0AAE9JCQ9_CAEBR|nr:Protein CBG16587 [Caenorhabditis briggsae]ULU01151.1 hypothetical protein L3Y34_001488 [Caenorhabditis briggsae]UMM23816.1 hypothetical protein L5515_004343 [Caenorhabditis briggsae]CAP34510.2 Protein CBG16587 [Caenorhabditis briggsae]
MAICQICQKGSNILSRYGILCCNACQLTHRYHCGSSIMIIDRIYNQEPNCRYCRFKRNLEIARINDPIDPVIVMLDDLSARHKHREAVFHKYHIDRLVSIEEALRGVQTKCFAKSNQDYKLTFDERSTMNQITVIGFLKNLDMVQRLGDEQRDSTKFVRGVRFRYAILATAFRSYETKKGYLAIANGIDIFPDLTKIPDGVFDPKFLDKIRCLLVTKLSELKVTLNEFLILSMILICASEQHIDLSDNGKEFMRSQMNSYGAALSQLCMRNDPKNGPVRFVELLSVCQVVETTYQHIESFAQLFRMAVPVIQSRELIKFE